MNELRGRIDLMEQPRLTFGCSQRELGVLREAAAASRTNVSVAEHRGHGEVNEEVSFSRDDAVNLVEELRDLHWRKCELEDPDTHSLAESICGKIERAMVGAT